MNIKNSPLFAESWNVAYRIKSIGEIFDDKDSVFFVIPNSKKYWAADPMVFEYNRQIFIFTELYDYSLCRGTIGYTVYDGSSFSEWKQVIVEDFHMSYPNVFAIGNDVYMIPETSEANKLLLYRAVQFPNQWEQVKTIQDKVQWVDTTFIENDIGYLAFTEQISDPITDLKLQFDNSWNLLSVEETIMNSKMQRNGGRIFEENGFIVRVCQNCKIKYGGSLIFRLYDSIQFCHEIDRLEIYPQQLVFDNKKIMLDGMHTYSATKDIEVIDIKTRRLNIINLFFRTKNKIKNLLRK